MISRPEARSARGFAMRDRRHGVTAILIRALTLYHVNWRIKSLPPRDGNTCRTAPYRSMRNVRSHVSGGHSPSWLATVHYRAASQGWKRGELISPRSAKGFTRAEEKKNVSPRRLLHLGEEKVGEEWEKATWFVQRWQFSPGTESATR